MSANTDGGRVEGPTGVGSNRAGGEGGYLSDARREALSGDALSLGLLMLGGAMVVGPIATAGLVVGVAGLIVSVTIDFTVPQKDLVMFQKLKGLMSYAGVQAFGSVAVTTGNVDWAFKAARFATGADGVGLKNLSPGGVGLTFSFGQQLVNDTFEAAYDFFGLSDDEDQPHGPDDVGPTSDGITEPSGDAGGGNDGSDGDDRPNRDP